MGRKRASSRKARITGAILMTSGRVPTMQTIFLVGETGILVVWRAQTARWRYFRP
jgi:hypothetical protein